MKLLIAETYVNHFAAHGFFLIPNPLGADGMAEVDSRQREVEPEWEQRDFPDGCNRLAYQFLMVGEPVLRMVEKPELVDAARRLLSGSQHRSLDEVAAEFLQLELATGNHDVPPEHCYAYPPQELELILDPRWTLVWTPSCWHATGVKSAEGLRRAMSWNYYPTGGRKRDVAAVKQVIPDWEVWSDDRKRLWGMHD